MQNIPNTTNTPKKTSTALNITFDEKLLNSLKAKQLQQQAKFRGIPICNHHKHFAKQEIQKLIYTYDNNITHMTDAEKEQYAKIDAMKKADTIKACKLQKIPETSNATPIRERKRLLQKAAGLPDPAATLPATNNTSSSFLIFDKKNIADMNKIQLQKQAKLRGLSVSHNRIFLRIDALRNIIEQFDATLTHLQALQLIKYTQIGAMDLTQLKNTCEQENVTITNPQGSENDLRHILRSHFQISTSPNTSSITIPTTNHRMDITFDIDTLNNMLVMELIQQAKLRGIGIFRDHSLLTGNEIRTRINQHDNAIKHLALEQKKEYAKIGAMPTVQIRELCAEKGIPTSSNIHSVHTLRNKLRFHAGLLLCDSHNNAPRIRQDLQKKDRIMVFSKL